jgi:hypothetical protein
LCQGQRVLNIHAVVANSVLDLRVTEQNLHGPEITVGLVDDRNFGPMKKMGSKLLLSEPYA